MNSCCTSLALKLTPLSLAQSKSSQCGVVITPAFLNLHVKLEENFSLQKGFQVLACGRPDLFQLFATFADDDSLLGFPFDKDGGV